VDFYCPQERIAVELDGDYHFTSAGYEADKIRDAHLNSLGIVVIRFENEAVFHAIEEVLEKIQAHFTNFV
jgi:very-short-patch-repair endonuclease